MHSTDVFHVLRRWTLRAKLHQSIRKCRVLETTTDGSEERTKTITWSTLSRIRLFFLVWSRLTGIRVARVTLWDRDRVPTQVRSGLKSWPRDIWSSKSTIDIKKYLLSLIVLLF